MEFKHITMDFDLDNYINWDKIAKDYSLESGDLSLHDTLQLEGIFYKFIETNKPKKMTTKDIKNQVFDMLHNLTYQKLEGNFKSDIESEQQDEQCELMGDILTELAKQPIEFHLNAYDNGMIDAEECVQAIDEVVNGVTEAP